VIEEIDGIKITRQYFGEVENLPPQNKVDRFIVSRMVAEACHRPDLLVPGPAVRDENGKIVGCNGLSIV
jgi:hypothetical protein